ncbi:PilW family protein [Pseudomonas indica]|uniref:PilW family protein n=1 Tax=Pseudomonas indica TaxID=137658 RepID=UPI000BAB8ADF|nr:prepilin-type N-terminal cleavage/methylation domain-containing protein [Pseudomonas indica]PAU55674.1 hypothetical protein BZL42_18940 [Pseudomonas indica]
MSRSFSFYCSKGLSLVELMVAMALSLIIGAAVIQMFLASKSSYRLQDSMARIQENGRFAVGFLAKDIRMAGFMGCGNIDEITVSVIANPAPIDAANPLGQIIGGVNNITATNSWSAVAGNEVLLQRKRYKTGVGGVGNMDTGNDNI